MISVKESPAFSWKLIPQPTSWLVRDTGRWNDGTMAGRSRLGPQGKGARRSVWASSIFTLLLALLVSFSASIGMPMEHIDPHSVLDETVMTTTETSPCDDECIILDRHCTVMNGCAYCAAIPRANPRLARNVTLVIEPRPASLVHGTTVSPDLRPPILAA